MVLIDAPGVAKHHGSLAYVEAIVQQQNQTIIPVLLLRQPTPDEVIEMFPSENPKLTQMVMDILRAGGLGAGLLMSPEDLVWIAPLEE